MAEIERPNEDVLVLRLSRFHSLDLVRIPGSRKYRIVFAERVGVQRRAFVEIDYEQARAVSQFLDTPHEAVPTVVESERSTTTTVATSNTARAALLGRATDTEPDATE